MCEMNFPAPIVVPWDERPVLKSTIDSVVSSLIAGSPGMMTTLLNLVKDNKIMP